MPELSLNPQINTHSSQKNKQNIKTKEKSNTKTFGTNRLTDKLIK
jgi:hypothetical protein